MYCRVEFGASIDFSVEEYRLHTIAMASLTAQVVEHVAKSLYDKITQEMKNTEDGTEFMKSIKFDRYNETSLCKSL